MKIQGDDLVFPCRNYWIMSNIRLAMSPQWCRRLKESHPRTLSSSIVNFNNLKAFTFSGTPDSAASQPCPDY